MPPDMAELTVESIALSFHESAHAVAALIRGVGFDIATIDPDDPRFHGFVEFWPGQASYADPENRAFIHFAGPYAESRFSKRPLDQVCADPSSRDDRLHFARYRSPAQDREWAEELDHYWHAIAECALRLLISGTIHPDHPDPLNDLDAIVKALAP